MTNPFTRWLLGVGRAEEVRLARSEMVRDRAALDAHLDAEERAFVAAMEARSRTPHIALGECPPGVPYRVALAAFDGTHSWTEVYLRDKQVASDTVESNLAVTATHVLVHVYADTDVSVDEPSTPWEFVHDLFNTPRANVPDALRLRDAAARVMVHDDHYSVVAD